MVIPPPSLLEEKLSVWATPWYDTLQFNLSLYKPWLVFCPGSPKLMGAVTWWDGLFWQAAGSRLTTFT